MQIHIVGNDDGSGHMDFKTVLNSFCTLNEDFLQADIQFYMAGPMNYIDNSDYFEHNSMQGSQMMAEYNVPNVINCYIVGDPRGTCGYYRPNRDAVALNIDCNQPDDHTWAHEIGHFLSLPHTFLGWDFGDEDHNYDEPAPAQVNGWNVEMADGSNCANAGDGFCDTPADYLDFRWSCNNQGVSNVVQLDPDSVAFQSDGSYFMSYSNSSCMNLFSGEQIAAMRADILSERQNMIGNEPAGEATIPQLDELLVLFPGPDEVIEDVSSATLSWEPVPNATHYIVQVNPVSIFSLVFLQEIVDEPMLTINDELLPGRTYYWRVRPYSEYDTCTDYLPTNSFETAEAVVSTEELRSGEAFRVFPNPVRNEVVNVQFTATAYEAVNYQLIDALGRAVHSGQTTFQPGPNTLQITAERLPAGLYTLRLQLNDRRLSRKLIVQK